MPRSLRQREAERNRKLLMQQRARRGEELLREMRDKKPPDILSAALAASKGEPLSHDPWNFQSVLRNQGGTPQAENFISIIRRTRNSPLVAEDAVGVEALWELSGLPWVRPLGKWKSKGKAAETRFRHLAAHLVCKYPMPPFLFTAFFIRETRDPYGMQQRGGHMHRNRKQMIRLFEYLAAGGSVRKAVQTGLFPVAFTKRMCHEFMQAPSSEGDIYTAIRYAQVKASGGSERLSRALSTTRMGRGLYNPDREQRLLTVIDWFCRQGMLNPDVVVPLYDYIEHLMQNPTWSVVGRTPSSLERGMHVWHATLNQRQKQNWKNIPSKFEPSGFKNMLVEWGEAPHTVVWSCEEILTLAALRNEGAAMKHCVSSYWHRIASGQTSIWSLQRDGHRQLTVEVDNSMGMVVQARGVCNKVPTPVQNQWLTRWASDNKIGIRSL